MVVGIIEQSHGFELVLSPKCARIVLAILINVLNEEKFVYSKTHSKSTCTGMDLACMAWSYNLTEVPMPVIVLFLILSIPRV